MLDKRVRDAARIDRVCRRLMTAPGVGAIVAMTFRAAVDQPDRFRSSKKVGACFGLTPRKYQSGQTDRDGAISRAGDASVRVALFEAAHVIMTRVASWSTLKAWAMNVARRRGAKRAKVALARKLGVVLTPCGSRKPTSASPAPRAPDDAIQLPPQIRYPRSPTGRLAGTMVRDKPLETLALRRRLGIGCPAPLSPHHVTIPASITDRSMNPVRQACRRTSLDTSPPMIEGLQLTSCLVWSSLALNPRLVRERRVSPKAREI